MASGRAACIFGMFSRIAWTTAVVEASARAYLNALNKLAYWASKQADPAQKVGLI